jgi:predicted Ser/Thr protein kinase
MKLTEKTYLARGKRGIAYTAKLGRKKVLLKEFNPKADINTIANEAKMLQVANAKHVGPAFIALHDGVLVREFVDGDRIGEWMRKATKAKIKAALLAILDQCRALDELGINKLEMTHPHKHILMQRNKPVMIDFDRARYATRPKNVTQVCQWMTSKEMLKELQEKSVRIDREAMLAHARKYKATYSKAPYEHMQGLIRNA